MERIIMKNIEKIKSWHIKQGVSNQNLILGQAFIIFPPVFSGYSPESSPKSLPLKIILDQIGRLP